MPRLFVDNLTMIDCSVLDPKRGLIGASWKVDVELTGELDEQGMVFDFSQVKKTIKSYIDETVDHKLLAPQEYEGLNRISQEPLTLSFKTLSGETLEHRSPEQAVCLIDTQRISKEVVGNFLAESLMAKMPSNVDAVILNLEEEADPGHYFCYSHGLKKHDGNCQRIAHGHRSQIQIWHNGKRSAELEQKIASQWADIYLGSEEDVLKQADETIQFAYQSAQGQFHLKLDKTRVHLMSCDSTIECIADHVLSLLDDQPGEVTVKAFEGIGKGAIAVRPTA